MGEAVSLPSVQMQDSCGPFSLPLKISTDFPTSFGCLVWRCRLSFEGFGTGCSVSSHSSHRALSSASLPPFTKPNFKKSGMYLHTDFTLEKGVSSLSSSFFFFYSKNVTVTSAECLHLASSAADYWNVFNNYCSNCIDLRAETLKRAWER